MEQKINFLNDKKEKLIGVFHKGKPKDIIIICHGYKSSKDNYAIRRIARKLNNKGFSVLRFDFTGHGESEGSKIPDAAQQVLDIESAINYANKIKFKKITLVGASFAGFVVAIAATKYKNISRIITINGLFNLKKIGFRLLLVRPTLIFNKKSVSNALFSVIYFKPSKIKVPVLVIHAKKDIIVDVKQSEKFYSLLKTKKRLEILNDADHNLTKEEYIDNVVKKIINWFK